MSDIAVLERLSRRPGSGVRPAPDAKAGEQRFSVDFRIVDRPHIEPCRLAHGGIVREIPNARRLHVESGWIRSPRPGARERLVWLVYLRPIRTRSAQILQFPHTNRR